MIRRLFRVPAKAGTQGHERERPLSWAPAFAGARRYLSSASSWARVATAITSGALPGMPGWPIGQVRRALSTPSAARRERNRARLVEHLADTGWIAALAD